MPYNYEIGKTYPLNYASVIFKDGVQYIVATDGFKDYTLRPYDYQTEYSIYPHVIQCYLRKISFNGTPCFEQLKEQVLKDRYQPGETHQFVVKEVRIDSSSQRAFYVLSDEYGIQHRYYPGDEETLRKSGDTITLIVRGILPSKDNKNNARLDLAVPESGRKPAAALPRPVYPKNAGKKNFGCENAKKEFKSSIAFPAGKTQANIGQQLGIICRTIAGFMNADGGTLYIGVSDNGYICGIENDFAHLNDGDNEYTYKTDDDGYLQRLTDAVCTILGRTAGTLVDMRMEEEDGKKYCIVDIKKASRPIWFVGNKLFVRVVTTNRKLDGDEITQFILDRVSRNAFVKQLEAEVPVQDDGTSETEAEAPAVVITDPAPAVAPKPRKAAGAWRHITFYGNGEWSFQKEEAQGEDIVCNVVVPSDARKNSHVLILAYENGHVEAVSLKVMLYGKNGLLPEGKRRSQGLCLANGKLVSAFCANKKDMLLLTSEVAGEQFVKALDVDTLGIHDRSGKGNEIVREEGAVLVNAVRIPDDDGSRVSLKGSGIFIEKNQKYTKGGVKLATLASNYRTLQDELSAAAA